MGERSRLGRPMMDRLDEDRCDLLAADLGDALKRHYRDGSPDQKRVYEALKALAMMSAGVICGTGGDLLDWYLAALSESISKLDSHTERGALQ